MKKATLQNILSLINGAKLPEDTMNTLRDEVFAEVIKGEAKAQANRDLYAEAKEIVLGALPTETPVTIGELYEEIADALPEGFSKGKVQYAITRMWASEVVKHEGKVNTYTRA